jgi:hypothetical protein
MTDQVFNLHGAWRVAFNGVVVTTAWETQGAAQAQLRLLESGYSTLTADGTIKHVRHGFPDTMLDRRAWEMAGDAAGEHISAKVDRAQRNKNRLKGVQLRFGGGPLAYRADSGNGTLMLCDQHLDLRRGRGETWRLTGEAFAKELCDDCGKEEL